MTCSSMRRCWWSCWPGASAVPSSSPLAQAEAAANRIVGSGDFTLPLPQCGSNEIGRTVEAFGRMTQAIKAMLQQALQSSGQCGRQGQEATQMSSLVAQATAGQVRDIGRISQSVQALTTSIGAVSGHSEHVNLALRQNTEAAQHGIHLATQLKAGMQQVGGVIDEARAVIHTLNTSSERIGGIAG